MRFNSLPFRTEGDTDAHNAALNRILEQTPALPLSPATLADLRRRAHPRAARPSSSTPSSTGRWSDPPSEPRATQPLRIIDQAALFVAPKTNYFLCSDLDEIAGGGGG